MFEATMTFHHYQNFLVLINFHGCPEQRNLDTVKAVVPHEFASNKHLDNETQKLCTPIFFHTKISHSHLGYVNRQR
jgi:hypothetical protein